MHFRSVRETLSKIGYGNVRLEFLRDKRTWAPSFENAESTHKPSVFSTLSYRILNTYTQEQCNAAVDYEDLAGMALDYLSALVTEKI